MTRYALLLVLTFCPFAAAAEVVRVTSGEHDGFSRLVLATDETTGWTLARVDGGFEFQAADLQDAFDLDRAFDRIPRDRISVVEDRGQGRLFLGVACDCHANAIVAGEGLIALDIHDGPAGAERAAFNQPRTEVESEREGATATHKAPQSQPALTFPLTPGDVTLPLFPEFGSPIPPVPQEADGATETDTATSRTAAHETEAALLEQMARAAAQGLLDPNILDVTIPTVTEPVETGQIPPVPPELPQSPPINDHSHVSITTSVDLANRDLHVMRTDRGETCWSDSHFDIALWGVTQGNGVDIGTYRSKIIGEFDEADGTGITALVRNYVFNTFGAEASALIDRYPTDIDRPDILQTLAEIMDHGQSDAATGMIDQMACEGAVALWAAAAQPQLYKYQAINGAAVRRTFAALPPHLRRHIGPALARKFLAIGDSVTANAIQDATARVVTDPLPDLTLLDAQTDLANGLPDRARDRLNDVINQADDILPEALIERVEAALSNDEAVPEDIISLVKSVGFEHRSTPTGAALARAEIRALASASHFGDAFERLDGARMDGTVAGQDAIDLSQEIFTLLVANASDQDFLTRTIARLDEAGTLRPPDRRNIALRLLALGFADQARIVLGGARGIPTPEDRLIFAQIALAQNKPKVAVGYLAGLEDAQSQRLRAEAMSTARDHAGAMEVFDALGDEDASHREAWRGGYWDEVVTRGEGPFAEAGRLITQDGAVLDPDAPQLSRDAALVETSQKARDVIEALLAATLATESPATPMEPLAQD